MKYLTALISLRRVCFLSLALGIGALVTGCDEANLAIDSILGRQAPVLTATSTHTPSQSLVPAKRRSPGTKAPDATQAPPVTPQPQAGLPAVQVAQGKRRPPGQKAPLTGKEGPTDGKAPESFVMSRDPFEKPTEVLPSGCPPSMPLCRFDRSQLKLVGIMQVSEGQYKGLVEDPDGRGYFVAAGTLIYGATVTQVTTRGITLHLHKTRQDVEIPLFSEGREAFD
jgi:hypothetical protein